MTREQQRTRHALEDAQHAYLIAYGWQPAARLQGARWTHPKLDNAITYTTHDALEQTRATPSLGWP